MDSITVEITKAEMDAVEAAITLAEKFDEFSGLNSTLFGLHQKMIKANREQNGGHDLMRELMQQGFLERGSYDWRRKLENLKENGYLWKVIGKQTVTFKSIEETETEVLMVKIDVKSKHKADPKEYNCRVQ